jgi:hypothetical protein
MKPAVFYTIEHVAAVNGREFRSAIHARFAVIFTFGKHSFTDGPHPHPFEGLMYYLTLYWGLAMLAFVDITAVVIWASHLGFAQLGNSEVEFGERTTVVGQSGT